MRRRESIKWEPVKYYSDYQQNWSATIEHVKSDAFVVEGLDRISILGDAPKSFIRLKEYQMGIQSRRCQWPAYIGKVGSKWYPVESVTEQLITRLGQILGADVTPSKLMFVGGQVRFLSRYFLTRQESLVHGVEISRSHLSEDFVTEVADGRREQEFFTFQAIHQAITEQYQDRASEILGGLVSMIGFDALVGNNDRHHANWGVITPLSKLKEPRFSPIFDTARALFWNMNEKRLASLVSSVTLLESYVNRSKPMIGWDGRDTMDHFELVRGIYNDYPEYRSRLKEYTNPDLFGGCVSVIDSEFGSYFSDNRRRAMRECLRLRMRFYRDAVSQTHSEGHVRERSRTMPISWKFDWTLGKRRRERAVTPVQQVKTCYFTLFLRSMEVGELTYDATTWKFKYSEEFKSHTSLRPIAQFPDLSKEYSSQELWPFFAIRIPDLEQSAVKSAIRVEDLDERNQADLLGRFGKRTISSPFELRVHEKEHAVA